MMIPINSFSGISDSIGNPTIGTAQDSSAMIRNRTRGWLELPDPYGTKFACPVSDAYNTLIVGKDIYSFYVAEHGGHEISVFIGTYTKVSRYSSGVTIPRFGVWIRPYWNGSSFVDAWLELTEIEIVQLTSTSGTKTLNFTDTGKASNYFQNWIAVFEDYTQAKDVDNYFLVTSSTSSSIDYFGVNASITTAARTTAGEKIILCRSFLTKELPASLTSHIFSYLNEIRLTTGLSITPANDISLMAGFRSNNYSWGITQDRIVLDVGCLDTWRYAALMDAPTSVIDSSPLAKGNYSFKIALGTDDGQIAQARDATVGLTNGMAFLKPSIASANTFIATDGTYIYRPDATTPSFINKYSALDYSPIQQSLQIQITSYVFQDILCVGGYVYVLWILQDGNNHLKITKIDPNNFRAAISTTEIVALNVVGAKFVTDGAFIYVSYVVFSGLITLTLYVGRFNLSLVNLATSEYHPAAFTDRIEAPTAMYYWNTYLFVGTTHTAHESYILKIPTSLGALIAYSSHPVNGSYYTSFCVLGTYLYAVNNDGWLVEKRNASDLTPVSSCNPTAATRIVLTTDNTVLYAYIAAPSVNIVAKNFVVSGSSGTYDTFIVLTNTTLNLIINTYLYGDGFIINLNPTTYQISSDGTQRIDFKLCVSAGAIPARMKFVYIYVSKDGGSYNRLFKRDLTIVTNIDTGVVTQETWEPLPYYQTTAKHFYRRTSSISIRQSDMAVIGAEITSDMGRAYSQSGVVRYVTGNVVGAKTYVGNFYDVYSSQTIKNNVLVNCVSGDGIQQVDVFDYLNPENVEYGDGDEIKAIKGSNDNILVRKKRSAILLSMDSNGDYDRNVVDTGTGICNQETDVEFDGENFWADYNKLVSFSTHSSIREINTNWVETWKAYTTAQKESAISVIDRVNKCWILCVGNDVWQYDLIEQNDSQWMKLGYLDIPIAIKENRNGYIDFLIGTTVGGTTTYTILTTDVNAPYVPDRFNGVNYSFYWKSNKIELEKVASKAFDGFATDVLVLGIIIEYYSTFAFQAKIFLDDASSAVLTKTIPLGDHKITIQAPLASRCKAPVIEFLGTTTVQADEIQIKSVQTYVEPIQRGDVMLQ
jgi:hypothetical protein